MKPRLSLIDIDATRKRKFASPRSTVLACGRELLHDEDWLERKKELWKRSKGQCEYMIATATGFERCRREAADPHHITPRGSNGVDRDDRLSNLIALCRRHHQYIDRRKVKCQKNHESA